MNLIGALYGYLDHLPQELRPPIVALILLVSGFIIALILRTLTAKMVQNDDLKQQIRQQIFWPIMLVSVWLSFRQFAVLRNVLDKLDPFKTDIISIVSIVALALTLHLLRPKLDWFFNGVKSIIKTVSAFGLLADRGLVIAGLLLFAASFSLQFPLERGLYFINGLALIGLGSLFAKVAEQVAKDIYNKHSIPKIIYYLMLATFMFEALKLFSLKLYHG